MAKSVENSQKQLVYTPVDYDPFLDGELQFTVPTTESQKEIWFSAQMGADASCAYNEAMILELRGPMDVDALIEAINLMVQRHEALRGTFTPDGENFCIAYSMDLDIPIIDLVSLSQSARNKKVAEIKHQEVSTPFNLERGLLRVKIVRTEQENHLVFLTASHIIVDGWSWAVMISDLGAFYTARCSGKNADLGEPEKFSEYARLQIEQENSPEVAAAENYWLQQFADQVPVLDLPSDHLRPSFRSYRSAREDLRLDPSLITALKKISVQAGCSFMTTLLAGFESFLYRVSVQQDLVVGVLAAGQAISGKFNLVGHCVNLLPIRSHVDGETPFSEYLQQRRSDVLDAYDHQNFTYGSLLAKLALPRDPSRIPLVSVMLNIDQAIRPEELLFGDLEAEIYSIPREFENFEWFINASEKSDNFVILESQYNADFFNAETIRRRLEEFEALLIGVVKNPQQKISNLPIMTQAERRRQLLEWNDTDLVFPSETSIHRLFEKQAIKNPDAVAVLFEEQEYTYRQLNEKANQLAHYLIGLNVGPDVLVGIYLELSFEMIIGLLGILKAGATYLPLEPSFPSERIAGMLEDSQVPFILTQESLLSTLPGHDAHVVCIDTDWESIGKNANNNPVHRVEPNNLAYVIYTSGSTGRPKGVQICHRAVVNFLYAMAQEPGFSADDHLLALTTISFDIAGLEVFLPLSFGASLEIVRSEIVSDGFLLKDKLNSSNATVVQATPASWQMLLEAGWQGDQKLRIFCGGESLPVKLAEELLNRSDQLWNLYGPTETTIWSTVHRVLPGDAPVPIGHPIANTQVYVLDKQGNPTPIGVPGELHIGGAGLAKGYLNRPNITKEKFVPNAFSNDPDARLYRTGDIARYRAVGEIEFLGRSDFQVKVRGFRIELGEVEHALSEHDDIKQSVVVITPSGTGVGLVSSQKRLVAYLIPEKNKRIKVRDLRQHLSYILPEYMIPSAFVELDSFPLTASGKVDRQALPEPVPSRPALDDKFIAPKTEHEKQILHIWKEVLRLERVGVHDNFFELGGHSLLATRVTTRLRNDFDLVLPLKLFFQNPTVEEQGQLIEAHQYMQEADIAPHDAQDSDTIVL